MNRVGRSKESYYEQLPKSYILAMKGLQKTLEHTEEEIQSLTQAVKEAERGRDIAEEERDEALKERDKALSIKESATREKQ